MGHHNEIKGLVLNQSGDFLELGETLTIVFKVIGKLVPNEHNSRVVSVEDICQPSNQPVRIDGQSRDAFFISKTEDVVYQGLHFAILAKLLQHLVC